MRSRIIYQNRNWRSWDGGFLTVEMILAFSLCILFTVSTFTLNFSMQQLKAWSLKELDRMKDLTIKMDNKIGLSTVAYGNDSHIVSNDLFSMTQSDYTESWGRNTCFPRLKFDQNNINYFSQGIDIGTNNPSTDIEVRNGIAYVTADSTTSSPADFFIIDARNPSSPTLISSINTGPGVAALDIAGPYAFLAQASTVNQLQILDIHTRTSPQVIAQLKLPLPTPTTTAPFASSIFYSRGYVYLGSQKWIGAEFSIIDVSNIRNPIVVGQFETNTLINDIYVRGDVAYLASSDDKQLRVLDIHDKSHPILIDSFSPSGWQTQEGKILDYFEGQPGLGRTVGGFNVSTNYEAFLFSTTSTLLSSQIFKDIPGGVYGLLIRPQNIFAITHDAGKEFQVFGTTLVNKVYHMNLGISPVKMVCDQDTLFFATGDGRGLSVLKLNN